MKGSLQFSIMFFSLISMLLGLAIQPTSAIARDWDKEHRVWSYGTQSDKLTDEVSSYAISSTSSSSGYGDGMYIGFHCYGTGVRFDIVAGQFIEGKGEFFTVHYRVDRRKAQTVRLETFSNSSKGGQTYTEAKKVAKDLLGGRYVFIRIVDYSGEFIEATISLKHADRHIKKVFENCGKTLR